MPKLEGIGNNFLHFLLNTAKSSELRRSQYFRTFSLVAW